MGDFGAAGNRPLRIGAAGESAEKAGSTINPRASTGYTATLAFIKARAASSISSVNCSRSRVSSIFSGSSNPMEIGNAPDTQTRFLRPAMCST